jgi:hypothetical protein
MYTVTFRDEGESFVSFIIVSAVEAVKSPKIVENNDPAVLLVNATCPKL